MSVGCQMSFPSAPDAMWRPCFWPKFHGLKLPGTALFELQRPCSFLVETRLLRSLGQRAYARSSTWHHSSWRLFWWHPLDSWISGDSRYTHPRRIVHGIALWHPLVGQSVPKGMGPLGKLYWLLYSWQRCSTTHFLWCKYNISEPVSIANLFDYISVQ